MSLQGYCRCNQMIKNYIPCFNTLLTKFFETNNYIQCDTRLPHLLLACLCQIEMRFEKGLFFKSLEH